MTKILNLALFAWTLTVSTLTFSCQIPLPTNSPAFCDSFRAVATCYCTNSGLDAGYCGNIHELGKRMIDYFGSIENACWYQRYAPTQDCIDNWRCYMQGGFDSLGRPCSGTGSACPKF